LTDNELLKQISEDVGELKGTVRSLEYRMKYVEIVNGDGMKSKLLSEDFFQKMYDKPTKRDVEDMKLHLINATKKMIKEAPINSARIIIRDLSLIGGMILILLKMFRVIPG